MNANERAYELLKWQALLPLADFDDLFPYAELQRQRSDKALDQWEKGNPYESSPELTAFRELERMGHYTQNDYYSPSKAADGFYSDQLKGIRDGSVSPSGRVRRIEASREARSRKLAFRRKTPKAQGGSTH